MCYFLVIIRYIFLCHLGLYAVKYFSQKYNVNEKLREYVCLTKQKKNFKFNLTLKHQSARSISSMMRAQNFYSRGRWFKPRARHYFSVTIDRLISDIESKGQLLPTADLKITWDQQSVTCRKMDNYWLFIQESRLGEPIADI